MENINVDAEYVNAIPDYLQTMIDYARNSIIIEIDRIHGYVSITDSQNNENHIFLQDEEGYNFIDRVNEAWNSYDLTVEEAEFLIAYPYCDIWN